MSKEIEVIDKGLQKSFFMCRKCMKATMQTYRFIIPVEKGDIYLRVCNECKHVSSRVVVNFLSPEQAVEWYKILNP